MGRTPSVTLLLLPLVLSAAPPPVSPAKVISHRPGLAFEKFTDPRETAFSVEVPKGWKTQGGMFRFAPVDTRGAVETVSPENDIRLTWGDPELPSFTLPNQMLAMTGFNEGSWYSPGYGVRMMVKRYVPGVQFAEEYVRGSLAKQLGCANLTITSRGARNDLTQAINAVYAQFGIYGQTVREDAGEVAFDCTKNGQPWRGYYLVSTLVLSNQNTGIWRAERLLGYSAQASRAAIAQAAMLRLSATIQVNPDWMRTQQGVTADTSRIVTQTNQQVSSTIRQTFESKWKTEDRISRNDANARRGTVDVLDPSTGETWTVQNSNRYYWRKPGSDVIVGTDTYDPPGVGFQPLPQN